MSFVVRSRVCSLYSRTFGILLRYPGILSTRFISSSPDGGNGRNGKSKKLDINVLLNTLKQDSDLEKIKPKNVLEKWKIENEQERIDIRSKLFYSNRETEDIATKPAVGESEGQGANDECPVKPKPGGDGNKIASDLPASLSDMFEKKRVPKVKSDAELDNKVKNILSELKVEAGQSGLAKGIVGAVRMWGKSRSGFLIEEYYDQFREGGTNQGARGKQVSFTSGPRLHLFDQTYKDWKRDQPHKPSLFEAEQSEEIEQLRRMDIGTNDFEEMMKIADKQWKFPVDNEVVKVEEQNVGFEEHVFLEYLLDEFPSKGPVRQFMELVINGLQMNPHLSVKLKKDQVMWFKEYFSSFPEADLNF